MRQMYLNSTTTKHIIHTDTPLHTLACRQAHVHNTTFTERKICHRDGGKSFKTFMKEIHFQRLFKWCSTLKHRMAKPVISERQIIHAEGPGYIWGFLQCWWQNKGNPGQNPNVITVNTMQKYLVFVNNGLKFQDQIKAKWLGLGVQFPIYFNLYQYLDYVCLNGNIG